MESLVHQTESASAASVRGFKQIALSGFTEAHVDTINGKGVEAAFIGDGAIGIFFQASKYGIGRPAAADATGGETGPLAGEDTFQLIALLSVSNFLLALNLLGLGVGLRRSASVLRFGLLLGPDHLEGGHRRRGCNLNHDGYLL